jgi:hypothetical protein
MFSQLLSGNSPIVVRCSVVWLKSDRLGPVRFSIGQQSFVRTSKATIIVILSVIGG